jgi:SAM-dependent methyltransferase
MKLTESGAAPRVENGGLGGTMDPREHWQRVWTSKPPADVSWYEREPATSLQLIGAVALPKDGHVVDVGGGASTLVDHLLGQGFTRVTVVDISDAALEVARNRLGQLGEAVRWLVADVRQLDLKEQVDLWHDRAVFHFLTTPSDQDAYLSALRKAVRPGGHVVIATFGRRGPQKCSGLRVERYDADKLSRRLGAGFERRRVLEREHVTPSGATQDFTYGLFRRAE